MRHIGYVLNQQQADRFGDYLLTRGIHSQIEEEQGQWAVWIRDEDKVPQSRQSLDEFQANPGAAEYEAAIAEAAKRRAEDRRHRAKASKNTHDVRRDLWNRSATKRMPVTIGIILLCVFVGIMTQLGQVKTPTGDPPSFGAKLYELLTFRAPNTPGDAWISIRKGQIWRLLTPALLHFSLLHIVFNMACLFSFGGQIESRCGWWLLLFLVVLTAIAGNAGQVVFQGPYFGGMSGGVYGLFGYLVIRQRKAPQENLRVNSQTVFMLLLWLALGFAGVLGDWIANEAHLFGMLMGMLVAFVQPE